MLTHRLSSTSRNDHVATSYHHGHQYQPYKQRQRISFEDQIRDAQDFINHKNLLKKRMEGKTIHYVNR